MIFIVPSRNEPVGRFLLPEPRRAWMPSSQRLTTSPFDHGIEMRWSITARLDDGHPYWRGWFDDRDDADAFLFAATSGTLRYERALWDLPGKLSQPHFAHLLDWDSPTYTGAWRPDLGEGLTYHLLESLTITSSPGSEQTITIPATWSNSNNVIKAIGSGGPGAVCNGNSSPRATGGGAAGYSYLTNHQVATPGSTTRIIRVGAARSGPSRSFAGATNGSNSYSDSYVKGSDNSTLVLSGYSGNGGVANASGSAVTGSAGAGGGIGTGYSSGGRGGSISSTSTRVATGGGSAGGPSGAGSNGGDTSSGATSGGSASGGTNAGAGGNGVSNSTSSGTGGHGGAYGGGGGGCVANADYTTTGGTGQQGVIWFEWTPNLARGFNMPMMGL